MGPNHQPGAIVVFAVIALLFAGFWIESAIPNWETKMITSLTAESDSSTLVVTVSHAQCANGGPRVRVTDETVDSFALHAEHDVRGSCDTIGLTSSIIVNLEAPVGAREIHIRPGPGPGAPWCKIDGQKTNQCQ